MFELRISSREVTSLRRGVFFIDRPLLDKRGRQHALDFGGFQGGIIADCWLAMGFALNRPDRLQRLITPTMKRNYHAQIDLDHGGWRLRIWNRLSVSGPWP